MYQDLRYLASCKDKDSLVLPGSASVNNIVALANEVRLMDDSDFEAVSKDIVLWIKDVIKDRQLYSKIVTFKNKESFYKQLRIRIDYLYRLKKRS